MQLTLTNDNCEVLAVWNIVGIKDFNNLSDDEQLDVIATRETFDCSVNSARGQRRSYLIGETIFEEVKKDIEGGHK